MINNYITNIKINKIFWGGVLAKYKNLASPAVWRQRGVVCG